MPPKMRVNRANLVRISRILDPKIAQRVLLVRIQLVSAQLLVVHVKIVPPIHIPGQIPERFSTVTVMKVTRVWGVIRVSLVLQGRLSISQVPKLVPPVPKALFQGLLVRHWKRRVYTALHMHILIQEARLQVPAYV